VIPVPICGPLWEQWHCLVLPPEKYWPYKIASFDVEPSAFLYALAQSFQSIKYYGWILRVPTSKPVESNQDKSGG